MNRPNYLQEPFHLRTQLCLNWLNSVLASDCTGDVVEFGVCKGVTTFPLAQLLKRAESGKKIFACDTFEGLPHGEPDSEAERPLAAGECRGPGYEEFLLATKELELGQWIHPIQGLFQDTVEREIGDRQFCFAWLDADLEDATLFAYEFLEDRVTKGGVIGFHDYEFDRCPGVKRVVDGRVDKSRFQLVERLGNQIFFQRV